MATLTKAHEELFRRTPDECYDSFDSLYAECSRSRERSTDLWERPQDISLTHDLTICNGEGSEFRLNDWSFSQLCNTAGVAKTTVNRLSRKTASKVFEETLPQADKPMQFLTTENRIRSVHGVAYTRLWNVELLDVVNEFASFFTPPQKAMDDVSTGLYCGEQDMFAFLIDPTGWAEIDGQAFAPGFFIWNSEVGRRSVGIQTFWFQKVCQNHIVWDATEVIEFTRKHTANVRDALSEIRIMLDNLVTCRDRRKDSFAAMMKKAMTERMGTDADDITKVLTAEKIPRHLIKDAMEIAQAQGAFTIFAMVDALTKLSQKLQYAGDRTALDAKIGGLLAMAA